MKFSSSRLARFVGIIGAAVLAAGNLLAGTQTFTVTSTADSGLGSLRGALNTAAFYHQENPGQDTYVIDFAIFGSGVHTITVASPLPRIDFPLTINGTTQDGYNGLPRIEISGAAGNNFNGFTLHDGTLTLRGLTINRFGGYGISAAPGRDFPNDQIDTGLIMMGCQIGTNAAGTAAAPNGAGGINLRTIYASQIGGTGTNEGNVISGNGGNGMDIDARGTTTIVNNKIGTNRDGTAAVPNQGYGVFLDCNNVPITVGGPGAARNIISGNTQDGLFFWGAPWSASVRNNIIGLGADGLTDLGNGGNGLSSEAVGISIGGTTASEGNVISGNGGQGIRLFHYFYSSLPAGYGPASCRNNLVGTDSSGTVARGNSAGGILVDLYDITNDGNPPVGDPDVLVNIGASGVGNVICGNGGNGITLSDTNAMVLGNLIGVTRAASPLGNASNGLRVINSNATVGQAPNLGNANIIGANGSDGIAVTGASELTAQGNFIGCTASGADVGNVGDGVQVFPWIGSGVMGVTSIGGVGAGMGNSIAYNNGDGIYIPELLGIGASYLGILGNSIWANGGLGIDLGPNGVTVNDVNDVDLGANHRQNFPVLTTATPTKVLGTLNSAPNSQYRIEFFRAEPDATGYGEGRYFLGAETVRTDATGTAQFGRVGLSLTAGQSVTATASLIGAHPDWQVTDLLLQDTSEFSQTITVGSEVSSVGFQTGLVTVNEGAGSISVNLVRSGVTSTTATVTYTALSGTATVGSDLPVTTGTVTFAAGQTLRTITVPITNDTLHEDDQHFYLRLSNPVNTQIQSPNETSILIYDNDLAPTISVPTGISITEGHTGSKILQVPITLSAASELPVRVVFGTVFGNTASLSQNGDFYYGPNYPAVENPLTFAPGETSRIIDFVVYGDTTVEADEYYDLEIHSATNATLGNKTVRLTILNDDETSAGTLQFSAATFSAAENAGTATITVSRTGGTGGAVSASYALLGGTATLGTDYQSANTSGTLNFAHGQSTASFTISLIDDYLPEGPETMQFQIIGLTGGATLGATAGTMLTITDSDAPGSLQFSAAAYTVAENAGTATLTVTRVGGTDGPATVSYSRTGGTASVGSDYLAGTTAGTLSFAHGQASASFTVTLFDDFVIEGPETITFQLSGAAGAALGTVTGATLTLADNETGYSISGRVTKADGTGIPGALVVLTGSQNASFTTDATGNYNFVGVVGGLNYAVVVTAEGWTFQPDTRTLLNLSGPAAGQDFTGSPEVLPELSMSQLSDGRIILSWPMNSPGWNLTSSTTMGAGSWSPVTAIIIQRGGYNQVILNKDERAFFRLERTTGGGSQEEM